MQKKLIKTSISLLLVFFATTTFGQNRNNSTTIDVDLPKAFFSEMFRSPTDKYLVGWSGGVTVIVKNQEDKEIEITGLINFFEEYLNSELTDLDHSQFEYNLNTPAKRVTAPNDKSWAGHCGYDPYRNVTFNDIKNGKIVGWPPEITSEVWGLNFSKKTSKKGTYKNAQTGKTEAVSFYFYANSTYYYHKIKPQSLKGKITRDDNYKACGKVAMIRLGPGNAEFSEDAEVDGGEFEFKDELFLGDYQVQYIWLDGTMQVLEQHIVYDPFGNPKDLEYELETFEGKISGKLVDEESYKAVKNQKVKLIPVCEFSTLPFKETKSDEEGKFKFASVPTGLYKIVTSGAPEVEAGLTKSPDLEIGEILVKNSKYDIYVTYTASEFAKAKLVWRNTTIKFPEDDETPQFFDMVAYRNSGAMGEPTGTDGEALRIPYTTIIPGIGKQTLYGWPENESAIPEVISVSSLGGYKSFDAFKVSIDEDALNACNISQNNNGPVYLELNFDLTGRFIRSDTWQQVDVGCKEDKEWNITKGNSLNGYPLAFKQLKFTEAEIEKFKNFEEFERILSNGRATLKIEFKLSEKE